MQDRNTRCSCSFQLLRLGGKVSTRLEAGLVMGLLRFIRILRAQNVAIRVVPDSWVSDGSWVIFFRLSKPGNHHFSQWQHPSLRAFLLQSHMFFFGSRLGHGHLWKWLLALWTWETIWAKSDALTVPKRRFWMILPFPSVSYQCHFWHFAFVQHFWPSTSTD